MKLAKRITALALAGSMLASMLPNVSPTAAAADVRAAMTTQKTTIAPVIDGNLDESIWSMDESIELNLIGEGADALQAAMGMMWDSKYLYIGVQNWDPYLATSPDVDQDPTNQPGDYWWDHPNVTLFIDPELHQSAPYQGKDVQLGFVYKPGTTTPYFSFGAADTNTGRDEKSILRAIQTTDDGWNLEVAIPWSFLGINPLQGKQFGLEVTVGSRFAKEDDTTATPTKVWSAYNSESFWNDTSGYGVVTLDASEPLTGFVDDVLLDEDFSGYSNGDTPFGWISNVNGGGRPFQVEDGRLVSDSGGSGQQARIYAPVQWDDYIVEADVQFQSVLNDSRWLSVIFRAPSAGVHPYNQMAIRQNGIYELAYRNEQNGWNVPFNGDRQAALELNKDYSLKVRVVGNNVKEYIKEADADSYELLMDETLNSLLLERGKVGFQIDQGKMSVASLKVTRVRATELVVALPAEVEALTGAIRPDTLQVAFSDGITEFVSDDRVQWHSSDEDVIRVVNNELVPLQEGGVEVTAVYNNLSITRQIVVTPSLTGKQVTELNHDEGYALTNVDEALELGELAFHAVFSDFSTGTMAGDELTWHADAADADIADGKLTVKRPGLVKVQAQADGASIDFYVAAKAASDSEYVLYEQDFSDVAEGALPEGWRVLERQNDTAIGVKDGYLELNADSSPARVLLPEALDRFGNYRIEAEVTHAAVVEPTRWHSVMYRVQNDNYPYYQMAVRQGATAANGVEFAERTPQDTWNVISASPYKEAIQADRWYRYTIEAYGNRVQQYINGERLIHTAAAVSYQSGAIGLQANGSVMKVAGIKVTLQLEELPKTLEERFIDVAEPQTAISLAPTVVAAIDGAQVGSVLNPDKLPATAMMHIGLIEGQLQVTTADRTGILQSLEEALVALGDKAMPAFYVHDEATVDALTDYLKVEALADAFVVSDRPELVKQARTAFPIVRGIIDFPSAAADLTSEQLMDIRRTTNANLAKIALLPERAASQDNVEYLQGRLITVWAAAEANPDVPSAIAHHKLITAGVNGIVTHSPETLIDALGLYNKNTTLIRKPWVIGHRGIPGLAPENTLEGAKLAYELGADVVENDIYLTTDNELVIMHDSTLERTAMGAGNVESYTLAELQNILANKQFSTQYPNARIPSLEQYFKEFKETDLLHFVEIKSYNPDIIDVLIELIKKYDVEDQVVVISFDSNQIMRMNEKLPGMSNGFLTGGQANDSDVAGSVYRVLNTVQPLNATFNSSYGGFGSKFLEASKHRGTTVWPWTYRNLDDFKNAFLMGTYGLTTDYNNWASDWANRVRPAQPSYELEVGGQAELKVGVRTYRNEVEGQPAEVVVLSGHELIEAEGGQVTAKASGTAYVTLRYTNNTVGGPVYDLYTQPIAVEVKSGTTPTAPPTSAPTPTPPTSTPPPTPPTSTPTPTATPAPQEPVYGDGVITIPAEVDSDTSSAVVRVDADKLAEQLQEAKAGADGTKTVRLEVQGSGSARHIEVGLPASALNRSEPDHVIEVVTAHGTVTLPAHLLQDSAEPAGDQVNVIIERLDAASIPDQLLRKVRNRPIVHFDITDGNHVPIQINDGAKANVSMPYQPVTEDANRLHTLVVWAIDGNGQATIVPGARYDAETGSIRGALHLPGTYAVAQADDIGFADLGQHAWAQTPIEALAARGIILGIGNNAYGPQRPITRADFVTLMVRMLGLQGSATDNFADVRETDYYYESLGIAKELGLIEGQGGGSFRPNGTISRQDMFTIVARAIDKLNLAQLDGADPATLEAFSDADQVAGYAKDGIAGLVAFGLVEGNGNRINPGANATRSETAVFLYRILNKIHE